MTIRHHPSEDVLAAHASGGLLPALDVAVCAHLDFCAVCRAEVALWDSVGGALLEGASLAPMSEGALDRALARIDSDTASAAKRTVRESALPPSLAFAALARERWLAPGVHMRSLWRDKQSDARAYLLRAAPGCALPHHAHDGAEMTCVLSGAFWDGDVRYGAGDFLEAKNDDAHQPRVDDAEECVCVIGSESAPRAGGLTGLIMRMRL